MFYRSKKFLTGLLLVMLALGSMALAADHSEAPGTTSDLIADIADLYAWHDAEANTLTAIITFAGLQATPLEYDANVLYTVHIDNDGDNIANIDIYVRFGQNAKGEWGIQVVNLPGSENTISGAVSSVIEGGNNTMVYAGLSDDPFFFDLQGFNETLQTGTVSFDPNRDSVAGLNIHSIVLEMSLSEASNGSDSLQVWATTGRR